MTTATIETTESPFSPRALELLQASYWRTRPPVSAQKLWDEVLTPADRTRLGGDFCEAFRTYDGTVGMWKTLRGVSGERALIDVAKKLNFLTEESRQWLLREVGELSDDPEEMVSLAVRAGGLVIVESPRAAYWQGQLIEIDWQRRDALWNYLLELARHSKGKGSIDRTCFGDKVGMNYVAQQKNRLTGLRNFPLSLADCISSFGRGSQKLDLSPSQIRILQLETIESLREWTA